MNPLPRTQRTISQHLVLFANSLALGFYRIRRWLNENLTPVVKKIVQINCAISLMLLIVDPVPRFSSVPAQRSLAAHFTNFFGQVPDHWYWIWQYVTYNFVHIDIIGHLLFNMIVLGMFGSHLEQRWGGRKFLKFYLLTGVGAGLFNALCKLAIVYSGMAGPVTGAAAQRLLDTPVIGASGAICGLLLAFTAYYPNMPVGLMFFPVQIKMRQMLIILIILDIIMSRAGNDNVSHLTHLSGFAVAYLLLAAYHRDWDIRHWRWHRE